ncbi:Hypothetical protein I596_1014 [Dokdonella koreensis DS-123]|uniref:Uncharacterized protein n=1 Tax=Dokdonella koreensis DS-123 TaxID=1300342 RepID=A0A160DSH3_9GAMM|nr:Hypothetical protein I596_1014 [Dokdonella koreensis DS-123]
MRRAARNGAAFPFGRLRPGAGGPTLGPPVSGRHARSRCR